MGWRYGRSTTRRRRQRLSICILTPSSQLKFLHAFFQVTDTSPRLAYLRIQTLLNLRVRGLPHSVSSINNNLFPLNLPVDLVNQVIVIHFDKHRASQAYCFKKITRLKC